MSVKTADKVKDLLQTVLSNGYSLILWNDESVSFEWVIVCLMDICQFSFDEALECAKTVHEEGKHDIMKGDYDELMKFYNSLSERGLTLTIESI